MKNDTAGHVLIVDDQENWRMVLTSLLVDEGYKVQTADSFEEAKREMLLETFDLIVLDVRLVDKDIFNIQGLELLQIIKSRENAPKVIIITGYPEDIPEGFLHKHKPDDFLLKVPPGETFNSERFKEMVNNFIG